MWQKDNNLTSILVQNSDSATQLRIKSKVGRIISKFRQATRGLPVLILGHRSVTYVPKDGSWVLQRSHAWKWKESSFGILTREITSTTSCLTSERFTKCTQWSAVWSTAHLMKHLNLMRSRSTSRSFSKVMTLMVLIKVFPFVGSS